MSGEQNYWTVLGVDGGLETGLLSEDGALEVARGGFSIEPFVIEQGQIRSWADVKVSQSLQDGYLPIPGVTWDGGAWQLRTTAFAHGTPDQAQLVARYQLHNDSGEPRTLRLVLAVRPFQVNPPMQFLNTPPGVSRIESIAWQDGHFAVNGKARVFALTKPDAAGVSSFDADAIPAQLAGEGWSARRQVEDGFGFASGALAYDFTLAPHASAEVALMVPLTGDAPAMPFINGWAQAAQGATAAFWRERLNQVGLQVPAQGQRLVDTLRSSLAQILMTRAGPALRPGTRSYARSWIRDGAMMSEGMLRLGSDQVAKDYARWFASYQFENGKVPCCVDRRGADPVPENDSQGEFTFLAAELWRYTHDRAQLAEMWPHVAGVAAYMEQQRQSERTPMNQTPARRHMFGLLPPSISHEGYSAKPMHSYWDDFWGLRGYRDAAMLAGALGKHEDERKLQAEGDEFERELLASLRQTARFHHIDYLAGAAELGDFDATSTTIALSPGRMQRQLPQDLLHGTFERYWQQFVARRDGRLAWNDYTPYELRNVAACVRMRCSTSSCTTAGRKPGTAGPRWSAGCRASRASSATCRTAGSRPTTSARPSTCSPTSVTPTMRWCSPTVSRRTGWRARACACAGCARRTGRSATACASAVATSPSRSRANPSCRRAASCCANRAPAGALGAPPSTASRRAGAAANCT
jgi:hypothetical protein